jgi:hypothetical protein
MRGIFFADRSRRPDPARYGMGAKAPGHGVSPLSAPYPSYRPPTFFHREYLYYSSRVALWRHGSDP